jgi:hypothetical protein
LKKKMAQNLMDLILIELGEDLVPEPTSQGAQTGEEARGNVAQREIGRGQLASGAPVGPHRRSARPATTATAATTPGGHERGRPTTATTAASLIRCLGQSRSPSRHGGHETRSRSHRIIFFSNLKKKMFDTLPRIKSLENQNKSETNFGGNFLLCFALTGVCVCAFQWRFIVIVFDSFHSSIFVFIRQFLKKKGTKKLQKLSGAIYHQVLETQKFKARRVYFEKFHQPPFSVGRQRPRPPSPTPPLQRTECTVLSSASPDNWSRTNKWRSFQFFFGIKR